MTSNSEREEHASAPAPKQTIADILSAELAKQEKANNAQQEAEKTNGEEE